MGREGQLWQAKKDGIKFSLREVPLGLRGFVHFQQNNKLNYGLRKGRFCMQGKEQGIEVVANEASRGTGLAG